ncbi:MAG TPA: hypothetical protein DC042_17085 [Bacteroidales bacterium]|nr:hypothetical protein [Bacteroidales bacterium]
MRFRTLLLFSILLTPVCQSFPQGIDIDVLAPVYFGQDIKCLREKKVLMPEKRDQLLNYIEKATGEENQIIVIMQLK